MHSYTSDLQKDAMHFDSIWWHRPSDNSLGDRARGRFSSAWDNAFNVYFNYSTLTFYEINVGMLLKWLLKLADDVHCHQDWITYKKSTALAYDPDAPTKTPDTETTLEFSITESK